MVNYVHLIPLFPFLAFGINILIGRRIKKLSALAAIAASLVSLVLSVLTYFNYTCLKVSSYTFLKWLVVNNSPLNFGVLVDPLTCMMLLIVTIIGVLVQVFSWEYMRHDPRFSRYFAYLSLFMASMLGLVLADNLIMLYIFWEGVGLCSYLLIAFWFERPACGQAGFKAFITTRIGDTGLFIGILILFSLTGTFNLSALKYANGNSALFTVAAVLIFCGAAGKSAQFPLHVWLPDAMEGPTPVSALIHAATMVAAGVYLVSRLFWLFLYHQPALLIVGYIGTFTAIFAASIAAVQNDIKRILAYSTISQLGLMMLGLGVGAYQAGNFHLMNHAFFKALLFLCAGSIIHAIATQDLQKMGGLFSKLKITSITLIIAGLSLAGVPPFSGFWSKDDILIEALKSGHPVLFWVGAVTSLLTAFYMFRLIFLALFGKPRSEFKARESFNALTIPLVILAVLSIFSGFLGTPFSGYAFQKFVYFGQPHALEINPAEIFLMAALAAVAVLGIALAYSFYILNNKILPAALRVKFSFLYRIIYNKYYIDEIYEFILIKPCARAADLLSRIDADYIIDGFAGCVTKAVNLSSQFLRLVQTGFIYSYLWVALFGLTIMLLIKFAQAKP